jgi:O-antigen/teichoic acid export membrane protein
VLGYLKRLIRTGAAYQASDILSKGVALFTLPLYTRYVSNTGYGYAETLLVAVILLSIVLRLGVGEAFIRFYYDDTDVARRDRIAAAAVAFVFVTTTIVAIAGLIFAGPLSRALLGVTNPALIDFAMLGVWAFTNLEIAEALLRADERTGTYMRASVANVVMSIILMVYLVVVRHDGARGLLAGNYTASALELLGLWWVERRCARASPDRRCRCGRCSPSGCRPCPPTRASTPCRSSTAGTSCAPNPSGPPGSTRLRPSSRPSSSSRYAGSSTRGRRWPTR